MCENAYFCSVIALEYMEYRVYAVVTLAIFLSPSLPPSLPPSTRYLLFTLDRYVEQDYTLLYFHHGFSSANKPSLSWMRQVYKELDRK